MKHISIRSKNPVALAKLFRRHNVAAGFYDDEGIFHPLRASYDYSESRAGETRKKKRKVGRKKKH
jgi:hypothetical protein